MHISMPHDSLLHVLPVGTDAILLGAETLRGLYPVDTISTVGKICAEVGAHLLLNVRAYPPHGCIKREKQ